MCGIVGFVGAETGRILQDMIDAVRHRGPDGMGQFVDNDEGVHLGHRRLAIIDLVGGTQPMSDAAGSIWVTYNGEIYNHRVLREELRSLGYVFRTDHSDTEVLIHGYHAWGEDLPRRLNGMFAFAVYDKNRRRLFLARDRFGEKPLYYSLCGGIFAFASEIQALLQHPAIPKQVSVRSLQKYFAHGFFPGDSALYSRVHQLPNGCWMTVHLPALAVQTRNYWRFSIEPDESLQKRDENRLADELRVLLDQAVQRRLMSDVPLGILLSGGIDSSAILAMAARHVTSRQLRTFTIGFREPSFDESNFAQQVAARFKTDHRLKVLTLDEAKGLIPDLLARMGEPLADPSLLPTFLLSQFTRSAVTVALSGDGGDELFAGYDPFRAIRPALLYSRIVPKPLHNLAKEFFELLLPISQGNMAFDFKLRRTLLGLSNPAPLWPPTWMAPLQPAEIEDLFATEARIEDLYSEVLEAADRSRHKHPIDRTLEYFTNFYLPCNILTKVDRASMMVGLETRAAMLDNDLVNFCERLPHHFKLHNGCGKYLLKKALREDLQPSILDRRKKGFGIPLAAWLKRMDRPLGRSELPTSGFAEQKWNEHRSGRRDHRLFLWADLALQLSVASKTEPTANGNLHLNPLEA